MFRRHYWRKTVNNYNMIFDLQFLMNMFLDEQFLILNMIVYGQFLMKWIFVDQVFMNLILDEQDF